MDTSTNKTDLTVSLLVRGAIGSAPFIGPLVSELISNVIPNQRIDRISNLLQILETKLADVEKTLIETRFCTPGYIDLFEDGLYQAARAIHEERLEHVASILKNGLSDKEADFTQYKHILNLLGEINEVEILILKLYSFLSMQERGDFLEAHKDSIGVPSIRQDSSDSDIEKATIHENYDSHLLRLGLLKLEVGHLRAGELPKFDLETGMIKAKSYRTSRLGLILLEKIDQRETT